MSSQDASAGRVCCTGGIAAASLAACPVVIPPASLCGNNRLDAGEQCDAPGILPATPPATLPRCPDIAGKKFTCTAACSCIPEQNIVCGDNVCSAGEMTFCATNPLGTIDCAVPAACSGTILPPPGALSATYAAGAVTINWANPLQCAPANIRIGRSTESLNAVLSKPQTLLPSGAALPGTTTTFTDSNLPAQTSASALFYSVILTFSNGKTANASVAVNVPTQSCGAGATTFCKTSTIAVTCDATFNMRETTCSSATVCSVVNGEAQCIKGAAGTLSCDACNGLFSMFPDSTELITEGSVPAGGPDTQRTCSASLTCYNDLRDTSVPLYSSCASLNSCAGYRTQAACSANQCGKPGTCAWRDIDPTGGTGKGVCAPQQSGYIPSSCSDCALASGGTCNRAVCEAIGTAAGQGASMCAYIDPSTGTVGGLTPSGTGCVPATQMPCEFYADRNQCEGGTTYQLNAQYSGTTRTGGSHTIISRSNDVAGHGKCVFFTNGCRKDSDKDTVADVTQYTPGQNFWPLSLDFTSPTTTILATPGAKFGRDVTIPFSSDGVVKACLARTGQSCYPVDGTLITASAVRKQFTIAESGPWSLFYYATDTARNLEIVQQYDFIVDGQAPTVVVTNVTKTVVRTALTGKPEMRQRTTVLFGSDEKVICNTTLQDLTGTTVPAASRGAGVTDLTGQIGWNFSVTYPALVDGSYVLLITCTDETGNPATVREPITANTDSALLNPLPVTQTPLRTLRANISIESTKPSTCAYGPVGSATKTKYTVTGGTLHSATVDVTGSGLYTYETTCNSGGTITTGDASDMIVFPVDVTAPTTEICNSNLQGCEPIDFAMPRALYKIGFLCDDQPVDSPNFDCAQTLACVAAPTAAPCTPTAKASMEIDGTKDWVLRYYSTDKGGNAEANRTVTITAKDVYPPAAPTFTLLP